MTCGKNVNIRKARPEDAENILSLLKIMGGETDNLTFGAAGIPLSVQQEAEYLEGLADSKTDLYLVASGGGRRALRHGMLFADEKTPHEPSRRDQHSAQKVCLGLSCGHSPYVSDIGFRKKRMPRRDNFAGGAQRQRARHSAL